MPPSPRQRVDHNAMTFGEHLEELRKRILVALLGLIPVAIIGFAFGIPLLEFLVIPLKRELLAHGLPPILQATGPLETFSSYMRVSMAAAVIVASPWLLWQLWLFVSPGLRIPERRFVYFLVPLSTILTIGGAFFLYTLMLPVVLSFFVTFGSNIGETDSPIVTLPPDIVLPEIPVLDGDPQDVEVGQEWFNRHLMERRICIGTDDNGPIIAGTPYPRLSGIAQQYRISEYTKLVFNLTIAFVVGFQTPVVMLLLGWSGIIDTSFLKGKRRYVFFASLIIGAVLTPADPGSMLALALPLYALCELGMVLLRLFPAKRVAGEDPEIGDE
jgi:sec-independent protein translocase protein TatC